VDDKGKRVANVTNERLYDALNSMRLELKADITDLRRQFETLEAGRLTRLEGKMSDYEVKQAQRDASFSTNQAVLSTKVIIIAAIGNVILVALATAIFTRLFK
jgi:hypothetical protein